MSSIGPGVNEIRIRDEGGAFRVIYVAKLEDAIYVLHAFQKKDQRTRKTDLDLAKTRWQLLKSSDERTQLQQRLGRPGRYT